jgi:hypothetical protein
MGNGMNEVVKKRNSQMGVSKESNEVVKIRKSENEGLKGAE